MKNILFERSELELAEPLRVIIAAGALHYLRMRHPMMTLGDIASGAGLPLSRVSEIERRYGSVLDDELLKLHRLFHRHGLLR